jgi:hypothetical protein
VISPSVFGPRSVIFTGFAMKCPYSGIQYSPQSWRQTSYQADSRIMIENSEVRIVGIPDSASIERARTINPVYRCRNGCQYLSTMVWRSQAFRFLNETHLGPGTTYFHGNQKQKKTVKTSGSLFLQRSACHDSNKRRLRQTDVALSLE